MQAVQMATGAETTPKTYKLPKKATLLAHRTMVGCAGVVVVVAAVKERVEPVSRVTA